ncbi:MAG TPA: hypothetical protein VFF58_00505 [Candidatus Nitrosotalea sp.]|nr:hypothetical protein [Candidatus Nitrosotalea sp.]
MDTKELEGILRWEENWFHEVSQTAPPTRLVALRLVRHAIWYLRSRHRSSDDVQAANVLLHCLAKMKVDSIARAA